MDMRVYMVYFTMIENEAKGTEWRRQGLFWDYVYGQFGSFDPIKVTLDYVWFVIEGLETRCIFVFDFVGSLISLGVFVLYSLSIL